MLIVNALQWVIAEAVTASAWKNPPHSYATNYISDLGLPDCGVQFQGRELCSPWHALMNTSFIIEGALFAVGVTLVAQLLNRRARRVAMTVAIMHGLGMAAAGIFHGAPSGSGTGLVLHTSGAGIGILCANTIAILAGSINRPQLPFAYRAFSVGIGVVGIISVLLVSASRATVGIFERGGVYSWMLWSVVTGIFLVARRDRRSSMLEVLAALRR